MTIPTRQGAAPATTSTVCTDCRSAPATHLITTPAGTALVCPTCRPIDLLPAAGADRLGPPRTAPVDEAVIACAATPRPHRTSQSTAVTR